MNLKINNFEYTFCVCFVLHFLSFVDGFGIDFGVTLVSNAVRVGKKRLKMRSRWVLEATLVPRPFLKGCVVALGSGFGPIWGPFGGYFGLQNRIIRVSIL